MTRAGRLVLLGIAGTAAVGVVAGVMYVRSVARARALGRLAGANVLLVTMDTTRADHLGCYGYSAAETPTLDALARRGVLFERCITPTAFTLPSHASIMTGRYPESHGLRLNGGLALASTQTTLAERLADKGYRTGAFVAAFVLDGRWGLKQGFQHYDDNFELKRGEQLDLARTQRCGDKVVDAALAWLDQTDARPFFAWVHLYDPHTPYDPPEPFRSRFGSDPTGRYDGEIAFTDAQVARLLGWLDTHGLRDKTIVAVVADHGEGLGSHGEPEHGYFIYDYAVHVPFILSMPLDAYQGVRVPAVVRTIDIAPTLLALVGLGQPADVDGQSLVPLLKHPSQTGPKYAYSESMAPSLQYGWSAMYSVRTDTFKFIDAPKPELYDLRSDPDELSNRIGEMPQVANELRAALAEIRGGLAKKTPETEEANIDEDTMRKLASLGYVGGMTTPKKTDGKVLADPKDMLHLFLEVGVAAGLIADNEYARAATTLEGVLKEDPPNPQARFLLAMCYEKTHRNAESKAILDEVLKDDPNNLRALVAMAGLLGRAGKTAEMIAICKRALAKDEHNAQAYALIADAYMGKNDDAGALPYLQKAVEIQPKLTRNRNNLAACLIGLGRLAEAETELHDILSTHPKFPLTHFNLGLLYENEGKLDEARKAYTEEVDQYPGCVPARFNLGDLLLRTGDAKGAEEQMRSLIKAKPEEPRAYLFLARTLLAESADLGETQKYVDEGLERSTAPELKALGYFLLADIYSRQGRRDDVEAALAKARYYKARMNARAAGHD
jgi:arylsulfatase A-like enzyme/tetratricopeptide (TPR) repeat protein